MTEAILRYFRPGLRKVTVGSTSMAGLSGTTDIDCTGNIILFGPLICYDTHTLPVQTYAVTCTNLDVNCVRAGVQNK